MHAVEIEASSFVLVYFGIACYLHCCQNGILSEGGLYQHPASKGISISRYVCYACG